MICPFCNNEMEKGYISGDGRSKVRWYQEGDKISLVDRVASEKGCIANVKYSLSRFDIESYYCFICQKIIFDADVKNG